MRIKQITLYNFRQYKGENTIVLDTDETQNISIISGKNGHGKTNFLMSLVWCLYGRETKRVDEFFKTEIEKQGDYAKYITNSLNVHAKKAGEHIFYVSIVFSGVSVIGLSCRELTVRRKYDANKNTTPEIVEILLDGQNSDLVQHTETAERLIRDFIMPIEAAKFFFFDAEKIVSLAEKKQIEEGKELNRAYVEVLGITKYEKLVKHLTSLLNDFKSRSASIDEQQKLESLRLKEKNLYDAIQKDELEKKENAETINSKQFEIREIENRLIKEGSTVSISDIEEWRKEKLDLELQKEEAQNKVKTLLELAPFAIMGNLLLKLKSLSDLENENKIYQFRSENFEQKSNQLSNDLDVFLVNEIRKPEFDTAHKHMRTLKDDTIKKVEQLIHKYFMDKQANHESTLVPSLIDFSASERQSLDSLLGDLQASYSEDFKNAVRLYNNLKQQCDKIGTKLQKAESNADEPIITEYKKNKNLLQAEVSALERRNEELLKSIGVSENQLNSIKASIAELHKKVEISAQYKDKSEATTRLLSTVQTFMKKYKDTKRQSLEAKILLGMSTLMHTIHVSKVEVTMMNDEMDIRLINSSGETIPKESLSKGQQQLYAMSLLMALVEESGIDFPIFIDSPLQKLDDKHIKNVIENFYPNISKQVVLLPLLHREFQERDYEILKSRISNCFLLVRENELSFFQQVERGKLFETYKSLYPNE